MTSKEIKANVIGGMVIRLTFDGGFQRSKIYKPNVSDAKRKEFRAFLTSELPKILLAIERRKKYNDRDHCKMIEKFSSNVSCRFSTIIHKKKFRIGNAQKFLNLYWKVAWLSKTTSLKPIHCPFDSIIMKKLPKNVRVSWTQFDTIEEYKALVKAAKETGGKHRTIADWEMKIYWDAINSGKQNA
ncbi:MAG: hypothetical protein ABI675_28620 [Chitinophagaceae bacterium]